MIEAAKTLAPVTSATPMRTGAAVLAVRRGLRWTLLRDIEPAMPRTCCTGAPRTRAIGLAITGPSSNTPTKIATTARPSRIESAPANTLAIAAIPSAMNTAAAITRPRLLRACSKADSLIAATGATLPAETAGTMAASNVVTTPATVVMATVLTVIDSARAGTPKPNALSRFPIPSASPAPATSPIAEPSSPITTASTSIMRVTWRRLAPIARKSAFSRLRCAAVIENTL